MLQLLDVIPLNPLLLIERYLFKYCLPVTYHQSGAPGHPTSRMLRWCSRVVLLSCKSNATGPRIVHRSGRDILSSTTSRRHGQPSRICSTCGSYLRQRPTPAPSCSRNVRRCLPKEMTLCEPAVNQVGNIGWSEGGHT